MEKRLQLCLRKNWKTKKKEKKEISFLGGDWGPWMVPTNKEVFVWFMTMWGKQILARAIEIQKEIWCDHKHAFLEIIKQQLLFLKTVKYKEMYGVLFKIEAFLSLKNAWLSPIFFLDTKSTC